MARQIFSRKKRFILKKTLKNIKSKKNGVLTPAYLIRLRNKLIKTFKLNVEKTKSLNLQRKLKFSPYSRKIRTR